MGWRLSSNILVQNLSYVLTGASGDLKVYCIWSGQVHPNHTSKMCPNSHTTKPRIIYVYVFLGEMRNVFLGEMRNL